MGDRRSALPWIRREDYGDIKRMMDDGETWGDTYDDWLKLAVAQEAVISKRGGGVERVMIEPWEFEVWCAAMGLAKDDRARLQFANENVSMSPGPDRRS